MNVLGQYIFPPRLNAVAGKLLNFTRESCNQIVQHFYVKSIWDMNLVHGREGPSNVANYVSSWRCLNELVPASQAFLGMRLQCIPLIRSRCKIISDVGQILLMQNDHYSTFFGATVLRWSIFDRIFLIFNIAPRGEY